MGQEIQLKLNNNNVSPTVEKVGDGNLQGFTATDLTGAANELKNTLNQLDGDLTALETEMTTVENGLAIIVNGNTSTNNVSKGQFVYLKNSTIPDTPDGLYIYNNDTQKTAGISFISTELNAVLTGGLNSIFNSRISINYAGLNSCFIKIGNIVIGSIFGTTSSAISQYSWMASFQLPSDMCPGKSVRMVNLDTMDNSLAQITSGGSLQTIKQINSGTSLSLFTCFYV